MAGDAAVTRARSGSRVSSIWETPLRDVFDDHRRDDDPPAMPGGGLAHEGEAIVVETVGLCDLARAMDAGEVPDMKTMLLHALRHRRPDLFTA